MNKINKFKLWARRSGFWMMNDLIATKYKDDNSCIWESPCEGLIEAFDTFMIADQYNAFEDYLEDQLAYTAAEIDEMTDYIDGEIEYADPLLHVMQKAWGAGNP